MGAYQDLVAQLNPTPPPLATEWENSDICVSEIFCSINLYGFTYTIYGSFS